MKRPLARERAPGNWGECAPERRALQRLGTLKFKGWILTWVVGCPPQNAKQGRTSRRRTEQRSSGAMFSLDLCRRTHGPPLLETLAAEHGPSLRRTERNSGFLPALRAGGFGFRALETVRSGTRTLRALGFAFLAPLGLVLEALVGEKHLLAGGEDELLTAFRALQDLIVIFHTQLRGSTLVGEPASLPATSNLAGIRRGRTWVPIPTGPRVLLENPGWSCTPGGV
jgi:hypothetical protein